MNQSHRYGHPQAACREPAGSYDKTTRTTICFEHKTQYLLNPCSIYPHCGILAHQLSNIPPMISQSQISCYRNWPRYGLRWRGWHCHQAQHELCRPSRGRAGRHNECCAWWQYHPRQRRPYKWSISILPRSQFYKKQGKLAFSTSCTAVRPHRRLRNDAWQRDS